VREASCDKDSFRRVLSLVDRRSQRIKLVEASSLVIRQQQSHVLEALAEALRDAGP